MRSKCNLGDKMNEALEWKRKKINSLKTSIKIFQVEIRKIEKEIEILNELVTKEEISEFELDFWRLSKEERTNPQISLMLDKFRGKNK